MSKPEFVEAPLSKDEWKQQELRALHPAALQFVKRANALGIKNGSKKYFDNMEAFYEGALSVAVNLNHISSERAGIINFMCSVGRLPEMHKMWLEKSL